MTLSTLFLIIAFIMFVLAAFPIPSFRVNLVALGLAFWVLAELVSGRLVVH